VVRVLLQGQLRGPVLQELEPLARRPEQPPQALPPPVPLQLARQQQLVAQQPQERQPVLPPAQELLQRQVRQPVHGAALSVWVLARR
jgi:hypothetical protein